MKAIFLIILILGNFCLFAADMSRTEDFKKAYKTLDNGETVYIGKCSTHQDYEKVYFNITKIIVPYFTPNEESRIKDTKKHLIKIDKELINVTTKILHLDKISDVDDLTIEEISSSKFSDLNLIRLNVGIGGGNGIFLVFNKVNLKSSIKYELISSIMDGDVEYCDAKVWLK